MDQILNFFGFSGRSRGRNYGANIAKFHMEKGIGSKNKHACFDKDRSIFSGSNGPRLLCEKLQILYSIAYIFAPEGHRPKKLIVYPRGVVDL